MAESIEQPDDLDRDFPWEINGRDGSRWASTLAAARSDAAPSRLAMNARSWCMSTAATQSVYVRYKSKALTRCTLRLDQLAPRTVLLARARDGPFWH